MKIWGSEPIGPHAAIAIWATAFLLFSIWLVPGVQGDEPAPADQTAGPIHISADRLISDSRGNSAVFNGHVKVVQDQTTITSDQLKLLYKEGNTAPSGVNAGSIDTIEATGDVRIEFDNRVAVGQKAVYTTDDRKLVLTGPGAKVSHGPDVVEGSSITYYRDTGKVEIVGQVNMTIRSDQRGLN